MEKEKDTKVKELEEENNNLLISFEEYKN